MRSSADNRRRHFKILIRIGHVPHLNDRDRNLTPVDTAHRICLPDTLTFCTGCRTQGTYDAVGKFS